MNPSLMKRLEKIEEQWTPDEDKSGIVFIQLKNETREDMEFRIDRWYGGEKVEGQEKIYIGGDQMVMRVVFVPGRCPDAA